MAAPTNSPVPDGPIIDPQSITDWLYSHDFTLPDNFITKKEAQQLGWGGRYKYVSDVAPGMSIGGDRFGNYEESLPVVKGRQYYEADCWYTAGRRNAYRIIYSDDGHVWYTEDHYQTFTELFPTVPAMTSAP
jgi:guanyl-specific ribonuclease Sa